MNGLIETEAGYIDYDLFQDEAYDNEGNEIEGESYIKIENLFVKKAYRGQGCAKALLTLAIAEIKEKHPSMDIKIVAEPKEKDVDLGRLIELYESFGLEVVAV